MKKEAMKAGMGKTGASKSMGKAGGGKTLLGGPALQLKSMKGK